MAVPAPYSTPIPGAPGYAMADNAANLAYKNALARINQQRQGTLQQYGYLGSIDPKTGVITNMRVDPYNAYGNLQTMLHNQAVEDQTAQQDAQERNLSGGWAHKGLSELAYSHGGQSAQLGTALNQTIADLQDQQNQAAYQRDQALYQAEEQAAQDAIAAGNFNQADYSGLDLPGYGQDPFQVGETAGTSVTSRAAPKAAQTVQWGGKNVNRNQLIRKLIAQGQSPSAWARAHRPAAARLGIGTKTGSNVGLIKKSRRGR